MRKKQYPSSILLQTSLITVPHHLYSLRSCCDPFFWKVHHRYCHEFAFWSICRPWHFTLCVNLQWKYWQVLAITRYIAISRNDLIIIKVLSTDCIRNLPKFQYKLEYLLTVHQLYLGKHLKQINFTYRNIHQYLNILIHLNWKTKLEMGQEKAIRLCVTGWKRCAVINDESASGKFMLEVLSGLVLTVWDERKIEMTNESMEMSGHWQQTMGLHVG